MTHGIQRSRSFSAWVLTLALLECLFCTIALAQTPGGTGGGVVLARRKKIWTTKKDWSGGRTKINTSADKKDGDVQLDRRSVTPLAVPPYIYIPNSLSNTIVQMSTDTGRILWTINLDSIAKRSDPSRTTVDANGDVWVGLRGTDKVVWISSRGRIKKIVTTGRKPRALAIDIDGHVWVGNWTEQTVVKINGRTGQKMFTKSIPCPYGATSDIYGYTWIVNRCRSTITKLDRNGNSLQVVPLVSPYGITTDTRGQIWVAAFGASCLHRISSSGRHLGCIKVGLSCQEPRGVAVDANNRVWVVCSDKTILAAFSLDGKFLGHNGQVGRDCVGVAVDNKGFIWTIARYAAIASKINPKTFQLVGSYKTGGDGPYTYSDMTGFQSRNLKRRAAGRWRDIYSVPCSVEWKKMTWNATIPAGTAVRIRARTASTRDKLAQASWTDHIPSGSRPQVTPSRWIEVEVELLSDRSGISPSVSDLTLTYDPKSNEDCNGIDDDCDGLVDNNPGTGDPMRKSCSDLCGNVGFQECKVGRWGTCFIKETCKRKEVTKEFSLEPLISDSDAGTKDKLSGTTGDQKGTSQDTTQKNDCDCNVAEPRSPALWMMLVWLLLLRRRKYRL
jgi:streptogramin lyase